MAESGPQHMPKALIGCMRVLQAKRNELMTKRFKSSQSPTKKKKNFERSLESLVNS